MKGPRIRIPPLHYVSRLSQTNSECWRSLPFQNVGRAHRPRMCCARLCLLNAAGNNWQPSRTKDHHGDGKKAFSNIICWIISLNITLLKKFLATTDFLPRYFALLSWKHISWLTFRHRASCILGQAFHYSPENAFYISSQQVYFIIWYLLDRASFI